MDTAASSGLPLVGAMPVSNVAPLEDPETLTSTAFLETLAGLSGRPGGTPPPATQPLATPLFVPQTSAAQPIDPQPVPSPPPSAHPVASRSQTVPAAEIALAESRLLADQLAAASTTACAPVQAPLPTADSGKDAGSVAQEAADRAEDPALALQWLPLTQFVQAGVTGPSRPPPDAESGDPFADSRRTAPTANHPAAQLALNAAPQSARPEEIAASARLSSEAAAGIRSFAQMAQAVDEALEEIRDVQPSTRAEARSEASGTPASSPYASTQASPTVAAGTADAAPVARAHVHEPVGSARWAEAIGARITLMAAAGQQNGSLTLSPEHLGPLEVRISVNQDNASVWFGAQQAETRTALTDAIPRLREMFAANGLTLGQASVSHETPRQGSEAAAPRRGADGREEDPAIRDLPRVVQRVAIGLIDTYA